MHVVILKYTRTYGNYFSLTRKTLIKKTGKTSLGKDMDPHYIASGNVNRYTLFGKVWLFLKMLKVELSYDAAIPLLDVLPREMKA